MKKRRSNKDDCLRQCVARVTGRNPRSVPHFVGEAGQRWMWRLAVWCHRVGWNYVIGHIPRGKPLLFTPKVPAWIEIGPTKGGREHAVVVGRARVGRYIDSRVLYDGGNPLRRSTRFIAMWRIK